MDFLDPRKKRTRLYQLISGYFLTAIAIGLGTVILVYGAYGYSINTKNGEIVQNGLLFVDSKPGGANIYLNGKSINSTTSARLVLPAGDYDLKLSRDGYHDWERKFSLDEHSVVRYVYPFLFPTKPATETKKIYSSAPGLFTQSPDRRWLLVQPPTPANGQITFDEFDTSNLKQAAKVLNFPAELLSAPGGTLAEVEWSTDNKHVLLQHTYSGGSEFIVYNRDNPTTSFNVNTMFNVTPTDVALRDKKIDQLYIYDQAATTIRVGDSGKKTLDAAILKQVLAFKPYGDNLVNYITDANMPSGQVQARILDNDKSYALYNLKAGKKYVIDSAEFQGHAYFIAGSDTNGKANVYKDPLSSLKNPAIAKAVPMLALKAEGMQKASFSNNTRFVGVEGSQEFAVYDFEAQERYEYKVDSPLAAPMHWMDGHRLIGSSNGSVFVMDYDSTNQHTLAQTKTDLGGYFSRDYNQLFTLTSSASNNNVVLERIDMRAGTDLPKQ